MRSFVGFLVGLIAGFLIVPILLAFMGIEKVGSIDAVGALLLAMFGGIAGAIVGKKTGENG